MKRNIPPHHYQQQTHFKYSQSHTVANNYKSPSNHIEYIKRFLIMKHKTFYKRAFICFSSGKPKWECKFLRWNLIQWHLGIWSGSDTGIWIDMKIHIENRFIEGFDGTEIPLNNKSAKDIHIVIKMYKLNRKNSEYKMDGITYEKGKSIY